MFHVFLTPLIPDFLLTVEESTGASIAITSYNAQPFLSSPTLLSPSSLLPKPFQPKSWFSSLTQSKGKSVMRRMDMEFQPTGPPQAELKPPTPKLTVAYPIPQAIPVLWFSSTPPFSPPKETAFVLADTSVESEVGYEQLARECGGIGICRRYACSQFHLFFASFSFDLSRFIFILRGSFRFNGPFIFRSFFCFCVRSAFIGPS
jgi:hypothetical protein